MKWVRDEMPRKRWRSPSLGISRSGIFEEKFARLNRPLSCGKEVKELAKSFPFLLFSDILPVGCKLRS